MQLTCYLPLILTLLATSSASFAHTPAVAKRQDELTPFKLRTEVINGGDNNLAGLYVQSYHTGAGLSDATLGSWDKAVWGILNDTVMQFNISSYPWSFFMGDDTTYDIWYPVRLNAGFYSTKFILNETGLQWDAPSFGGWLACVWSHGVPQLFWKVNYKSYPSPVCSQVELYLASEDVSGVDNEKSKRAYIGVPFSPPRQRGAK
ncbi:hypothetical protein G7Y79_00005g017190 [Physcia stellaris]|nr:hypothetical protein G7Y79_00005g017190 [Physcia stellaris]